MFLPDGKGFVEKNVREIARADIDIHKLLGRISTPRPGHFDMIAKGISLLVLMHCNAELQEPTILVDTRRAYGMDRLFLNEGISRLGTELDNLGIVKDCAVLMPGAPNQAIQQFELTNTFYAWMQGPTHMSERLPASVIISPHSLLYPQVQQQAA